MTPLLCACYYGHQETAEALLEAGARVDAISSDGETALHLAATNDEPELIRLLMRTHDFDVNALDNVRGRK